MISWRNRQIKLIFLFITLSIFSMSFMSISSLNSFKKVDIISISFAPTVDPEKIVAGTQNLEVLLKKELLTFGFEVERVEINVLTSYDAAAESLLSGSSLIAFMPTTTFALSQDFSIQPFLEGLRYAQNVESSDPMEWNIHTPNYYITDQFTSKFYSQIMLGPSDYGLLLKEKFIKDGSISWEDLSAAKFCFGANATSSATYIYPSMWLYSKYSKTINDISYIVPSNNSTEMVANLAMEVCDVAPVSSMSRIAYEEKWMSEWERNLSIWEETFIIGISEPITNGMFAISKVNEFYNEEFKLALEKSFINISKTEQGLHFLESINLAGVAPISADYLNSTFQAIEFVEAYIK